MGGTGGVRKADPAAQPPNQKPKHTRRSHHKSRGGCQNCKRRKVKCDEVKPTCGNCHRFSMQCDFSALVSAFIERHIGLPNARQSPSPHPHPIAEPSQSAAQQGPQKPRGRGRPRKDWVVQASSAQARPPLPSSSSWASSLTMFEGEYLPMSTASVPLLLLQTQTATKFSPTAIAPNTPSTPSSSSLDTTQPSLNVDDLELMHHFMANVAQVMGELSSNCDDMAAEVSGYGSLIWREVMPKVGFDPRYPSVLHLLLALSAFHKARMCRRRRPPPVHRQSRHDSHNDSLPIDPSLVHDQKQKHRSPGHMADDRPEADDVPATGRMPQPAERYLALADRHVTFGLPKLPPMLASLSKANSMAAYFATVLSAFCAFARGPTGPGDLLLAVVGPDSDDVGRRGDASADKQPQQTEQVAWVVLMRGVKFVVENMGGVEEVFQAYMEAADAAEDNGNNEMHLDEDEEMWDAAEDDDGVGEDRERAQHIEVRRYLERRFREGRRQSILGSPGSSNARHVGERPQAAPWDWARALAGIEELVTLSSSMTEAMAAEYNLIIGRLKKSFSRTFPAPSGESPSPTPSTPYSSCTSSTVASPPSVRGDFPVIMSWIYSLDVDAFGARLQGREPVILLILAHFAVLLGTLEYAWFLEGWGEHIAGRARAILLAELEKTAGAEGGPTLDEARKMRECAEWPVQAIRTLECRSPAAAV